jgi:hypothetical protein
MAEAEYRNAALTGQSLPAFQNASSDRNSDISYLVSGIWQRRRRLRIPSAALSEDRVRHQCQTGADPPPACCKRLVWQGPIAILVPDT